MAMSVGSSDSDSTSMANTESANTTTATTTTNKGNRNMGKRTGKRPGRKPAKIDERAKLERSRQSAKECRARKKLRYQYLEELVLNREKAVFSLREELEMFKQWCIQLDKGTLPEALVKMMANEDMAKQRRQAEEMRRKAELHKQKQQQQQKLLYQQDLPSTSSVGAYYIPSKSPVPSPSSTSSSSPSPPQISRPQDSHQHHPHYQPHQSQLQQPHHPQHQQLSQSRLQTVPPPPYPGTTTASTTTTSRQSLTRQMAFDDSAITMESHHVPQQHNAMVSHSFLSRQPTGTQTQPRPLKQTITIPKSAVYREYSSASAYPQKNMFHRFQKQSPAQDGNMFMNKTFSSSKDVNTQKNFDPRLQQQQRCNAAPLQGNIGPSTALNTTSETMPASTLAYLDDISDLISQETTRNPTGQFTTASSTTTTSTYAPITENRIRSLSNPPVMLNLDKSHHQHYSAPHPGQPRRSASFTNAHYPTVGSDGFHNTLKKVNLTGDASLHIMEESSQHADASPNEIGLFSGIPLAVRNATSSAISDVDSDSGEENSSISRLFQSSSLSGTSPMQSQKRTLSDPDIHHRSKKARSLDSEMDSATLTESLLGLYHEGTQHLPSSCSPLTKLNSLTTMKCMGSTGTLNTMSATSPFGFVPRNTDSPMTTSSGMTSPVPSCQSGHTGSSPAPQVSSFLETSDTSSTLSSAFADQDIADSHTLFPSTPTIESFLFNPTTTASPVVCSETGLSATISEPIPEWYSFLADLQAESTDISLPSTPTTTPIVSLSSSSSSHLSHFIQPTSNQKLLPMVSSTSSARALNVPSILEEISSEDST